MPSTKDSKTAISNRQARAERILDATAGLLLRHGYKRVSIDDVATTARVGKGTVYLHWKTREALFGAVLGRETMELLSSLVADLEGRPGLALPSQLTRAMFVAISARPLIKAVLLGDSETLGSLTRDDAVASSQSDLAFDREYADLLVEQRVLRDDISPESASHILASMLLGFFATAERSEATVAHQADLMQSVIERAIESPRISSKSITALNARVVAMFTAMVEVHRTDLEKAF